ncbi:MULTISPECIES: hypothetical protein [unclassified Anabaena]|uniref:hypothetical protein n=1 Tax=unclassified Anabaena TaxID=2619674 RepID=UPI0039C6F57A
MGKQSKDIFSILDEIKGEKITLCRDIVSCLTSLTKDSYKTLEETENLVHTCCPVQARCPHYKSYIYHTILGLSVHYQIQA